MSSGCCKGVGTKLSPRQGSIKRRCEDLRSYSVLIKVVHTISSHCPIHTLGKVFHLLVWFGRFFLAPSDSWWLLWGTLARVFVWSWLLWFVSEKRTLALQSYQVHSYFIPHCYSNGNKLSPHSIAPLIRKQSAIAVRNIPIHLSSVVGWFRSYSYWGVCSP